MMTGETLNLGLIGAGRIGLVHAEHLAARIPNANLLMVADVSEAAAQECARQFRVEQATNDYRAVLDRPDIHAVLICSATDTHATIIEEAARAGKHIFCEKPIALNLAAIDRALAAVERAGVKLQIGFNRRFDANYRRVRQAIVEGEIGQPQLLHIISRDPAPPPVQYVKVSGGIFLDMSIHDFDMARFLIGSEVDEVYTAGGVMIDPAIGAAGDLDTALVLLTFANGVIGTVDNSRKAVYGYDQRVEVLGSEGAIATDNNYPNSAVISDARRVRRDLPLHFFMDRYTESFVAELKAFIEAVLYEMPVPVTGQDGRAPVVIALAAGKSFDEKRPVRLSEVEQAPQQGDR
jgi:myo-inositol 2-dehydrogenase/D-chiro-inositol 1-dehydrogenase